MVVESLWNSVRIRDGELVGDLNVDALVDLPSSETVFTKVITIEGSCHNICVINSYLSFFSENF